MQQSLVEVTRREQGELVAVFDTLVDGFGGAHTKGMLMSVYVYIYMLKHGFIWFHMVMHIYVYINIRHIFPIFGDYSPGYIFRYPNSGSPVLDQPVSSNDTGGFENCNNVMTFFCFQPIDFLSGEPSTKNHRFFKRWSCWLVLPDDFPLLQHRNIACLASDCFNTV